MSLLIGWQSPYWFQNRQQKIKENSKHGAIWSNIKRRCFDLRVLTCQRLWDYIKKKLCKSDRVVLRRLIDICSVLRKKFFLQVKAWWVKKVELDQVASQWLKINVNGEFQQFPKIQKLHLNEINYITYKATDVSTSTISTLNFISILNIFRAQVPPQMQSVYWYLSWRKWWRRPHFWKQFPVHKR